MKRLVLTVMLLCSSTVLSAKNMVATMNDVCCPKSEQLSDIVDLLQNKRALAMYMIKNNCALVEQGKVYKIVDSCKGALCQYKGVLMNTGKKYCSKENFDQ